MSQTCTNMSVIITPVGFRRFGNSWKFTIMFLDYLKKTGLSPNLPHFEHHTSNGVNPEQEQLQLAIALSLSEAEGFFQPIRSGNLQVLKEPVVDELEKVASNEDKDIIQIGDLSGYERMLDQLLHGLKELQGIPNHTSPEFNAKIRGLQKIYGDCLNYRLGLMQYMNTYKNKMDELVHLSSLFLDARTMYQEILRMDENEGLSIHNFTNKF